MSHELPFKGRTLQQEGDGILTYIDFRFVQLHLEDLFCSVASYCTALLQVNILNVSICIPYNPTMGKGTYVATHGTFITVEFESDF